MSHKAELHYFYESQAISYVEKRNIKAREEQLAMREEELCKSEARMQAVEREKREDVEYTQLLAKFDHYVAVYKDGKFLDILRNIEWYDFKSGLATLRGRTIAADKAANLESVERMVATYTNLINGKLEWVIVSDKESLRMVELAGWLRSPKLNGKLLSGITFTDCAQDTKQVESVLTDIFQRAATLCVANCELTEAFLDSCHKVKGVVGVDFTLQHLNLSRVKATPKLLSSALQLLPPATNKRTVELDAKGYTVKGGPTQTTNTLTVSVPDHKEIGELLRLLPSGAPKHVTLKDNAYTKDLVFEDPDVIELALETNNMFNSSFAPEGAFPKLLNGLTNLQILKLNDLTFSSLEAKAACLKAAFTHKPQLQVLELRQLDLDASQQTELLAYIKNNKNLTTLDLRGSVLTAEFVTALEKEVVHRNLTITTILADTALPANLVTALNRNKNKASLEEVYKSAKATIEQFSAGKDAKEATKYEVMLQRQAIFLKDYQASLAGAKAFYPTPELAGALKTQYHQYLPKIFEEWMAVARQTNDAVIKLNCHQKAFDLLKQQDMPIERIEAVFRQYINGDVQDLEQLETDTVWKFLEEIFSFFKDSNDQLALLTYHVLVSTIVSRPTTSRKKGAQVTAAKLLASSFKSREMSLDATKVLSEVLLSYTNAKPNLTVAGYALLVAKDLEKEMDEDIYDEDIYQDLMPYYAAYLRALNEVLKSQSQNNEDLNHHLRDILNKLKEIESSKNAQIMTLGYSSILTIAECYLRNVTHSQVEDRKKSSPDSGVMFDEQRLIGALFELLAKAFPADKERAKTVLLSLFKRQLLSIIAQKTKTPIEKIEFISDGDLNKLVKQIQGAKYLHDLEAAVIVFNSGFYITPTLRDIRSQLRVVNDNIKHANQIILKAKLPSAPLALAEDDMQEANGVDAGQVVVPPSCSPSAPAAGSASPLNERNAALDSDAAPADEDLPCLIIQQRLDKLRQLVNNDEKRIKELLEDANEKEVEFNDRISLQLIVDPVLASDGGIYDRATIEKWMSNKEKWLSPLKNTLFSSKRISSIVPLRSAILAYLDKKIALVGKAQVANDVQAAQKPERKADDKQSIAVAARGVAGSPATGAGAAARQEAAAAAATPASQKNQVVKGERQEEAMLA